MDSRGIPIVLPGNKHVSSPKRTPKRKTTAVRNDIPPSPYNVKSNEPSLLEIYDSFADACFQSHYNHSVLNDDYRFNIQEFYKTDMCPSDNFQSNLVPPSTPKRHKSNDSEISSSKVPDLQASRNSMFICSQQSQQSEDVNFGSEYMEEDTESAMNNLTVTAQITPSVVQMDMIMGDPVLPDFDSSPIIVSKHEQTNAEEMQMSQDAPEPALTTEYKDVIASETAEQERIEDILEMTTAEGCKIDSKPENNIIDNGLSDKSENVDLLQIATPDRPFKDQEVIKTSVNVEPKSSMQYAPEEEEKLFANPTDPSTMDNEFVALDELSRCSLEENDVETTKITLETEATTIDQLAIKSTETVMEVPVDTTVKDPQMEVQMEKLEEAPVETTVETQMDIPENSSNTPVETPARRVGRPKKSAANSPTATSPIAKKSITKKPVDSTAASSTRRLTRSQKIVEEPIILLPAATRRSSRRKSSAPVPELPKRMTRSQGKPESPMPKTPKPTVKTSPKRQAKDNVKVIEEEVVNEKSEEELVLEKEKKAEMDKYEEMRRVRDKEEIDKINQEFPSLKNYYELVERAGRGTFSKVYKAKDLLADYYMPIDEKYKLDSTDSNYVAVKVIFDISSPKRVADEIECLTMFRSSPCITPLITAFRHEANTYVVLPYIEFDHFDDFYSDMTLSDVRSYISQLLTGLEGVHKQNIMHRDVKPGNFLYCNKTKVGYLADFGLAQKMNASYPLGIAPNAIYTQHQSAPGAYMYDKRPSFQANRSGTKGFRAPEIMLKYANQTTAIDIWAVGVILLIILGGKYPFFNPDDDADGIMEIAQLFGSKELKAFTEYYGRRFSTNIPSIPEDGCDLADLCRTINKDKVDAWDPEEYLLAVDLMKQCLQLIHTKRCTATEALEHPFLQQ